MITPPPPGGVDVENVLEAPHLKKFLRTFISTFIEKATELSGF